MTNQKKYVAYVSTYTMGDNHGITIYSIPYTCSSSFCSMFTKAYYYL